MAGYKTNRKTGGKFATSGAGFGHDTTHSVAEYEAAKAIGIPAKYYETIDVHRDPLEAWNELMRSAEFELKTSPRAETGEIQSYADTDDDSSMVDLGNQSSYPNRISVNVDIPDSSGKWYNLSGTVYRYRGRWKAGAELEALDEES